MSEMVLVRQNSRFEIGFWALETETEEEEQFQPVMQIHDLSPYGMLMASLGSCTTIVVHTFAQNHDIDLDEVEIVLRYERDFDEDCENCLEIERYTERIKEEIEFSGNLSEKDRSKLAMVAHHCSIHKMLESGIEIESIQLPLSEKTTPSD